MSALPPLREAIRLERGINIPQLPLGITLAALLSSAWAILLSRLTVKDDIIYSQLKAGRNAAIEGVEDIVGPYINIISKSFPRLFSDTFKSSSVHPRPIRLYWKIQCHFDHPIQMIIETLACDNTTIKCYLSPAAAANKTVRTTIFPLSREM